MALVWAAALLAMAAVFWFSTEDDPVIRARRLGAAAPSRPLLKEFEPLRDVRVWRFALYYFRVTRIDRAVVIGGGLLGLEAGATSGCKAWT